MSRDVGDWEHEDSEGFCDSWRLRGDGIELVSPVKSSGDGGWSLETDGPIDHVVTPDDLRDALRIMGEWRPGGQR